VRAAIWARDLEGARSATTYLAGTPETNVTFQAFRVWAAAAVSVLEGRDDDGLSGFRQALAVLRELELDFELARVSLDMVILFGPDRSGVQAAADEARAIFERLRARAYLDLLSEAMARSRTRPPAESAQQPLEGTTVART
jgi:hypothetical protein